MDCDAFYASIEKRDNPELQDKPVLVGGGRRGVVSAACYVARTYGCRSAMPMFKALKACPDAVVIRPDMAKYSAIGKEVRALMQALTPAVEPLSLDEAFMDLTGTERLHGAPPAVVMAGLARRIEAEIRITASVGLSHNKFLAKVASDLDKPRGCAVIGAAETVEFLAAQPVSLIWGVGKQFTKTLAKDGIRRIGDLQALGEATLAKRYGELGLRLGRLAWGKDQRIVKPPTVPKSISGETTFEEDIPLGKLLDARFFAQCERVARRARAQGYSGQTVTLKLKTADFKIRTRSVTLDRPTQYARDLYDAVRGPLEEAARGEKFRLIGVGLSRLTVEASAPAQLFDDGRQEKTRALEESVDRLRARFGDKAVEVGRVLPARPLEKTDRGQQDGADKSSNRSSRPRKEKSP
jgi:DNA polymerase-4